jgi:hypothetical protein
MNTSTPKGKRVLPVAPCDSSVSCLFEAALSKVSPRPGHAPFVKRLQETRKNLNQYLQRGVR